LIVFIDETWAFEGMGPSHTWHDPLTERNPMAGRALGLTAGPAMAPTKGKRVIIGHAITEFGPIKRAGKVWKTETTPEDGDYHRYIILSGKNISRKKWEQKRKNLSSG
jgi:hypothetical protein